MAAIHTAPLASPILGSIPAVPDAAAIATRLSVVIVNYRSWEETTALVRQLRSERCVRRDEAEVLVVDNHSFPDRIIPRLRRWTGVSLRRWKKNRGFARAANEGCRLSRGHWYLLLNPDVTVPADFLAQVLAAADRLGEESPDAGIVGFQLRNSDGSQQLSAGAFPTLLGTLLALLRTRARRKYLAVRSRCRVPWVTGCCLLVKRECWQQLGGFDRDFFLYYEDVDLCRRARARGWSVWYEPALRVVHHHPLHSRRESSYFRLLTRHALLTYACKHWPGWQFSLLTRLIQVESWLRQQRAAWAEDEQAARHAHELGVLAQEMGRGEFAAARRRLDRVVRRQEDLRKDEG